MKLREIQEGEVKLKIPDVKKPEQGEVFYNPIMEMDRNISVCLLPLLSGVLNKKRSEIKALDALSATGVRALRYTKETKINTNANDANPKAFELIKKNAKLNNVEMTITEEDANIVLRKNKFDFIDIDPFGSPVPFLDSAARSFPKEGFLAVTATDTAPLCGTYPKVCLRRYGIKSFKSDYYNEMGIRILISSMIRAFAKYEKRFMPYLSYSRRHYFRVYGKIESGVKKVNDSLKEFGYMSHCFNCGWRAKSLEKACPVCGAKTEFCEVYLGKIQNKKFLNLLAKQLQKRMLVKEENFIQKIDEELASPFYYDIHYICKKSGKQIKKTDYIISRLKSLGFKASRTHFCPTAIKTDADFEKMIKII